MTTVWRSSADDFYITYAAALADTRNKKSKPTLVEYVEDSIQPEVFYCLATSAFYRHDEVIPDHIKVLGLIGMSPR